MNLIEYIHHWLSKPDLKTPVSLIISSLNELKKETALSNRGKKSLTVALTSANRLEELLSHKDTKQTGIYSPADDIREKETILLVEANTDRREFFRENLSVFYGVIHVDTGNKALELARETNPDIIIADAFMPGMSGYELCRILKSAIETSHIPVILLSALNEKENIIFGLEAGANDYIVKPFDFDILKARIRNILQSREQLRKTVFSPEPIEETSYTNDLDVEFLDRAIGIIEKELDNSEFSINEFCGLLAMSRTSVYNKLKSLTNQAPNDFIRIIRLNRAKDFLMSGKYTVSEVSYRVGFTDPKYFSTSFKKQFGISPSKINNSV
ncbi:MAG: DNA-binding response regulator [Dysgonamonadaceae bacterium]|jgi:DNA-binding response OmpR family regulator|nr:DNA-binding response regulator [Dysgonamonadaceae bacterium]